MKNLTFSAPVKIIAGILFTVFTSSALCLVFAVSFMIQKGFYVSSEFEILRGVFEKITYKNCVMAGNAYSQGSDPASLFTDTNFSFTISDADGKVLSSSADDGDYLFSFNVKRPVTDELIQNNSSLNPNENHINITGYISKSMSADDKYSIAERWIHIAYSARFVVPIEIFILSLLALLTFAFIIVSAGAGS